MASSGYLAAGLLLLTPNLHAVTNDLSATLSKGLFEEEANHNLGAAIQMYQSVIDRFDTDRKLAATAVFRLGECYRKQGNTNEANAQYQRILREFADQTPLVTLSGQNLSALAVPAAAQSGQSPADRAVNGLESPVAVADAGELSRVEAIIKDSPDLINAPDPSGLTLLQNYAAKGDLAVVKLLLDHGAAADGIKQPGLTPLHYAAGNGHKSVVELLLNRGAKPNLTTAGGVTPLHLAVYKGYEQVAKALLEAGAPVNAKVTAEEGMLGLSLTRMLYAGETPLHAACQEGYHSIVDLLISKGAEVNTERSGGFTPLSTAVQHKDEPLVKTLLAARADPNAGGSLALNVAAGSSSLSILELLLAHGANPNPTNHQLPLVGAIAAKSPEAVKKLIQFKADPNFKEPNGWPVLFRALPDPPTLQALMEGGADPNLPSPNGNSPLAQAIIDVDPSVEVLLQHGADPNWNDASGVSALHCAVLEARSSDAELLLKRGARVNSQNKYGSTPLHEAVRKRDREITALLLAQGADPNIRNAFGQTPLDFIKDSNANPPQVVPAGYKPVARMPGTPDESAKIADLLLQHGAIADLPRPDRIEVRRPSANYSSQVFLRGTNDFNRFSLLELIAAHYGFVSTAPYVDTTRQYTGISRTVRGSLGFPNLDQIVVRRAKPANKESTLVPVSVRAILSSGDCAGDVWLEWGDQVEIPELDHPLDMSWKGFSVEVLTNLQNCTKREVHLAVKGQMTNLVLKPSWPQSPQWTGPPSSAPSDLFTPTQFCLVPTLQNSGLLRLSSDLSHVKVTRHDPKTGESWERVFDCSASSAPALWLRDGDIIEVPDKP